jgi:chromosome segregation ATPase
MAIDAGSIASELTLDTSKYMVAIEKAAQQMKTFESRVTESGRRMETALSNLDKQYKLWQLSTNNVTKALEGKGKQVDLIKQKMGLLDAELEKNNKLLEEAKQKYGANSKEVQELEGNILDLKVRQAELNQELKQFDLGPQLQKAGKRMEEIGQTLTTKVTLPLAAAGAIVSKVGMDFEAGMSEVQAISGATGDELFTAYL